MFFPEELKRDYSVACHRLLQLARQEFGKHFEFVWVVMPNGNASFRSDRFNVLPIAKAMGGGGHTKASGTADKEKIAEVLEQNGIQYPRS